MYIRKIIYVKLKRNCRKIQENKDYTLEQGRKMNEMLNQFQDKFEKELVNLQENL